MWYEYIGKLLANIGSKFVAAGAAIVGIALLIFGYRRKVDKAKQQGVETGTQAERERIKDQTEKQSKEIKDDANEIRQKIADIADDTDARRNRMRSSASDRDN